MDKDAQPFNREHLLQYRIAPIRLGDKAVKRSSRNIRHIRRLHSLVWAAYFANELSQQRKTSTLRDVYYSAQAYEIELY